MKKRVISAIVALLIFVPLLLIGGIYYKIFIFLLSIQGVKEMINAFNTKKEVPLFIQFISYLVMSYFILVASDNDTLNLLLDFRLLIGIIILYIIPVIIYQNDKTYGIIDAFSMIGCILILGISFSLLIIIRNINLTWIIYLFIIAVFTDTYAFISGKLIGKHKCTPKISPNKTWEGAILGTVMGVYTATVYITTVTILNVPLYFIILMTLFLSIIGQFGDLIFSAIKRNFKIKDFSNFMPGHGGILDRFDSIFFILMTFTFFINIL